MLMVGNIVNMHDIRIKALVASFLKIAKAMAAFGVADDIIVPDILPRRLLVMRKASTSRLGRACRILSLCNDCSEF
jgi:hypothetical protein